MPRRYDLTEERGMRDVAKIAAECAVAAREKEGGE